MGKFSRSNYQSSVDITHADNATGSISAGDGRGAYKDLSDSSVSHLDDAMPRYSLTTGSVNAYVLTIDYPQSYQKGFTVLVEFNLTNTSTSPTINITPTGGSALGVKTIKDKDGNALASGDLVAGNFYSLAYDGTYFRVYSGLTSGVVGPDSSVDNQVVRFNGTSGNSIQSSGVEIDDSDNITGVDTLNATALNVGDQDITVFKDGDWTPSFANYSGATPTVQIAKQTRVNNMATVIFRVDFPSNTDTSDINISGISLLGSTQMTCVGVGDLDGERLTFDLVDGAFREFVKISVGGNLSYSDASGVSLNGNISYIIN